MKNPKSIEIDSWTEILEYSPIDLSRVESHASAFKSHINIPIMLNTMNVCKRQILEARNELDQMILNLMQTLSSRDTINKKEDAVLFLILKENLGRLMFTLDEDEKNYIINPDNPNRNLSRLGITNMGAYLKSLKNVHDSLYESLIYSIKEYYQFEQTESIKREPRTFLYILFDKLSMVLSFLGGETRTNDKKKSPYSNYPTNYQSMMGNNHVINKKAEELGINMENIPDDMFEKPEEFGGDLDESNN